MAGYDEATQARLTADAQAIIARYPQARSALLPMLHLVQSVDGYITGRGVHFCAEQLELTTAEVSGVATFYTQYKRHPNGEYTVGVCTNTLCAIMGGDQIFDELSEHLGVGHDETTEDGKITLERLECNAACDFAPVMMVNWEFMDNQTPESAVQMVEALRSGHEVSSTRGPKLCTWREAERVLAGFPDGLADEGPTAGEASLAGLRIAREAVLPIRLALLGLPVLAALTPVAIYVMPDRANAAADAVLRREGCTLSTYGLNSGPQGYRPLREFLEHHGFKTLLARLNGRGGGGAAPAIPGVRPQSRPPASGDSPSGGAA